MTHIVVEILLVIILILVNGLLAMSEIAIVSARRARLQQLAKQGHRGASTALELSENPNKFLSTVQVGITLVGILAGAFGGATIADVLSESLSGLPLIGPYSDGISLAIVVLLITYLSLVIGELAPKRLALNNPEKYASMVSGPMDRLSKITGPVVRLLSLSTSMILRIIGAGEKPSPPVTEEEIEILITEATLTGILEPEEKSLLESVFDLDERKIRTLMTHRSNINWVDLNDPKDEIIRQIIASPQSCLPAARDSLDHVVGVIDVLEILQNSLAGKEVDLEEMLHKPVYIPENASALDTLEIFRQNQESVALVIDEFGGLEGLLTLSDLVKAIIGDLWSERERQKVEAVRRPDGTWLMDGILPIEKFKEIFSIDVLPGEEEGRFETLGGFIMTYLGQIPQVSDNFEWQGLTLEVIDMDGRRIDKVLVSGAYQE